MEIEISGRLTQFNSCNYLYLHYTCKSLRIQCFFCGKTKKIKNVASLVAVWDGVGYKFIKKSHFPGVVPGEFSGVKRAPRYEKRIFKQDDVTVLSDKPY